ncbi:MAG: efflux RND transporter periplasmic adaptor subunit, partial [Sedimentisphaerales bacterium]|nr:efflux RND transporter periplasmic adaptor subunit [Sedimentisphaerales bacterium]
AIKSPQPSEGFIKTAKQKLLLMGMSDAEIGQLEAAGKPQQELYLPDSGKVWVYITIYEYESGLVKEGLPVEVETSAYPGQAFSGKIVSISPIVESMARSLKVRALVDNPENKLKLRMYVNVQLKYDLGEKLAVPEEAVMHTGMRDIVFIADPNGYFTPTPITLGAKAQGYYEVLDGVKANEEAVTSGNFLIDSESKLNAVLSQMADIKDANK